MHVWCGVSVGCCSGGSDISFLLGVCVLLALTHVERETGTQREGSECCRLDIRGVLPHLVLVVCSMHWLVFMVLHVSTESTAMATTQFH